MSIDTWLMILFLTVAAASRRPRINPQPHKRRRRPLRTDALMTIPRGQAR
jgi:hypothetical protein